METVQSVHMDHGGLQPQSQMAFAQRASMHRGQPGDGSPYKPARVQSNPAASAPLSPGSARANAAYPGYASAAGAQTLRYVQQQPYSAAAAYRDLPYTSRNASERLQPVPGAQGGGPEYAREPPPAQMRPRISLLPAQAPLQSQATQDYLNALPRNRIQQPTEQVRVSLVVPPSGVPVQLDMGPGPPFKKMRLGDQKQDVSQPIRISIDTREQQAYNPQVEAISPTLPNDSMQEDASFRSTKDDLLQQIGKVDREIAKAESQILKLKKKLRELEEVASKPLSIMKEEEEISLPKHQSLAQKIYADNRKRALDAHHLLDKLGPKVDLPLYNQPSDTAVYHENKLRHLSFKSRLREHFKRKHAEREVREKYLTETYSTKMQEWIRKTDKIESSTKRKAKEAKNREFFEKVFPELRKQREDRERFNRVGNRVKSEADLEEIMDGLQEQENEEKKMRSYAVIPPISFDAQQRQILYVNNNGRIEDFASEYKERQLLNIWTEAEQEVYKEKYLQHPKNFGVIASYFEGKSVCDSIQFYYLSKKYEGYKTLLRKTRQRTRTRGNNPHGKVSQATQNAIDILSGPTGVTTRLQREQQQKQDSQPTITASASSLLSAANSIIPSASVSPSCVAETQATSIMTTPVPSTGGTSVITTTASAVTSSSSAGHASLLPAGLTNTTMQAELVERTASGSGEVKVENKKKERRKEEKKKKKEEEAMETSDEECQDTQEKGGPHPCVVCKATVEQYQLSRPLPRSHASQYGLRDEDITPFSRVCNTCRCKSVRSRYTQCPMPTCPNAKGRAKRLRTLPGKWPELSAEIKEPIIQEFQIPPTVTKACSACFNRISRRLAPLLGETPAEEGDPSTSHLRWSPDEIDSIKRALKEFGLNWAKAAERVATTKTSHQCKNFYFNYRKKLGLDQLVQEYNKNHLGEERKPALTDEEESGSSTSSCDEPMSNAAPPLENSDTDSAHSPRNHPAAAAPTTAEEKPALAGARLSPVPAPAQSPTGDAAGQPAVNVKDDYDSSATETADEGQGGADTDNPRHSPKPPYPPNTTSITAVPSENGPTSPLRMRSVKDLMLGVIEMQLMKTPGGHHGNNPPTLVNVSSAPTISSILKTDHRSDITFVREYKSGEVKVPLRGGENQNLATLSVVNSHHTGSSSEARGPLHHVPQMQATITPCPVNVELPKEGLVVVQVQQAIREREPETLDLSVRKPRDSSASPLASIVRDPSPMSMRGSESPYMHHLHHRDSPALPPQTTLHSIPQTTIHSLPPGMHPSSGMHPSAGMHQGSSHTQATLHTIPPPAHSKAGGGGGAMHHPQQQQSISVYRTAPGEQPAYYQHSVVVSAEQLRNANKSPSVFVSAVGHPDGQSRGGTPHLVMNQRGPQPQSAQLANKINKTQPPPMGSKLSPKLAPSKGGSITHGTPVANSAMMATMQPRYEGLLRMTPPQKESSLPGSITQGTPVHLQHHLDKRDRPPTHPSAMIDYYKRLSPAAPNAQQYFRENQQNQQQGNFTSPYPARPSYAIDQQLSSRQIIMNDYITSKQMHTSQQMHTPHRGEKPEPPQQQQQRSVNTSPHYYQGAPPPGMYLDGRMPRQAAEQPPPSHHTPPPRQGVIQRHNTVPSRPPSGGKPPSPAPSPHSRAPQHFAHYRDHHYPPGHEALSSLVDLAVQQPSLPVPDKQRHHQLHHEGLGKTISDNARLLDHQMERDRIVQAVRDRDHQTEQRYRENAAERERFAAQTARDREIHQERLLQSSRERDREQQEQQRFNARERERERDMQQQQLHLQQIHQQQLHRQQQQQQQARIAGAEFEHRQQLAAAAAYRDHQEREASRMMAYQQREGPPPVRHHPQPPPQHVVDVERENAAPRERAPPPPSAPSPASSQRAAAPAPTGAGAGTGQAQSDSTMTAASLIDAIITHQINQSADTGAPAAREPPATRPGDRLFQSFHREPGPPPMQQQNAHVPESNGKSSPLKPSAHSPNVMPGERKPSPPNDTTKVITLGEHIDSIISKDFNNASPAGGSYPMHHRGIYPSHPYHLPPPPGNASAEMMAAEREREQHSWKLRRVLQQKEMEREKSAANSRSTTPSAPAGSDERQIIRIAQPASPRPPPAKPFHHEQSSPPETSAPPGHHWLPGAAEPMGYPQPGQRFYQDRPQSKPHISALDYVKNRIVEVMRTSEDEKSDAHRHPQHFKPEDKADEDHDKRGGDDGKDRCDSPGEMVIDEGTDKPDKSPAAFPPTTYAYPFSALSVPATAAPTAVTGKPTSPAETRQPEPAPLLSAQYEPLSDED